MAANRNGDLLLDQAARFGVQHVCLSEGGLHGDGAIHAHQGVEGMCELVELEGVDVVVVAVAGAIGILPTHRAIRAGRTIALASKEVLVAAGKATMDLVAAAGVAMVPVDSEHSAIFQCLQGAPGRSVDRIVLTASGGPLWGASAGEIGNATVETALAHPTWNMGALVTVNSATLMNKALELMEARWLFDTPASSIDVVVHRQSIVHSLVQFLDGSILAQAGLPDMRLPIQYALTYPERVDTGLPRLRMADCPPLTFERPDEGVFPALRLGREALEAGGTMPAVMNAANEAAVGRFLAREMRLGGVPALVEDVMRMHEPIEADLANVLAADEWARRMANEWTGAERYA